MFDINIDISQVDAITQLNRGQFVEMAQKVVEGATNSLYRSIHREANKSLRQTRQVYKRNIGRPEIGRLKGSITLTGTLPNMIESGASPFDMKRGFERSRKVKRSKNGGWYLTIPFRYATAGSLGDSEAFSGVMPKEIEDFVKSMKASITVPFLGTVRQGGQIKTSDLAGSKFGVLGFREKIRRGDLSSAQSAHYEHKSPQFSGLGRSKKFYEIRSQGQYKTFRRVSSNSAVNSWIHKGLEKRDLFGKAASNTDFDRVVAVLVDGYMTKAGIWQ